jgi:hypothetical protein
LTPQTKAIRKPLLVMLTIYLAFVVISCGANIADPPAAANLAGNWQITLNRHANPVPLTYSGFLLQSGTSITGSFILGDGCQGVGPVTGSLLGQNVQLTVNEFGQDVNLTAVLQTGNAPLNGEFSTLAGGCTEFPSTGAWSSVELKPLSGTFHGTFISSNSALLIPTLQVTGIVTQGPNIGASNATLSGTLTAASYVAPCAYLTNATIVGTISGETVVWNLYSPNGALLGRVPLPGGLPQGPPTATISADGSSLTGSYQFQSISSTCTGDQGSVQLTFP